MFQGVVRRIFWNLEYDFVPINASWQEKSWLAGCGKGWDCGSVHKIITKIFLYTKWCVKSRWFSRYKFGKKRPVTFSVNWQLVSWNHPCPISWDKAFSREVACPIIYKSTCCCWVVSLSPHIEKSLHVYTLKITPLIWVLILNIQLTNVGVQLWDSPQDKWYYAVVGWSDFFFNLRVFVTPVAGRIFETKNWAIFLERFFGRGIFAREQLSRAKNVARF